MKFIILSSEINSYVPKAIKDIANANNILCEVVDYRDVLHIESAGIPQIYINGVNYKLENNDDLVFIPRLSDEHLETKLNLLLRLETMGFKILNSSNALALCNDKIRSALEFSNLGLAQPTSVMLSYSEQIPKVIDQINNNKIEFPVILKTIRGSQGLGVMKIDSQEAFTSVAQTLLSDGHQLLCQNFIDHKSSYRMVMVGHELLAANERFQPEDKHEFRTNSHLGSTTKAYNPTEKELDNAKKIVDKFGINFCAIDYVHGNSPDELLFLEVNGSPGLEGIQKDYPQRNLTIELLSLIKKCLRLTPDKLEANDNGILNQSIEVQPASSNETIDISNDNNRVQTAKDTHINKSIKLIEPILIHRLMDNAVDGKADTGASLSCLHVDSYEIIGDVVSFVRNNITYKTPLVRLSTFLQQSDKKQRPVICLDVSFCGQIYYQVEFSLADRSNVSYEVLIGRNLLGLVGIPVEVPVEVPVIIPNAPEPSTIESSDTAE